MTARPWKDVQTGQQIEESATSIFDKCRDEIKEVESTLNNKIDTEVARFDSEVKALNLYQHCKEQRMWNYRRKWTSWNVKLDAGTTVVEQKIEERTTNIVQMSISEI